MRFKAFIRPASAYSIVLICILVLASSPGAQDDQVSRPQQATPSTQSPLAQSTPTSGLSNQIPTASLQGPNTLTDVTVYPQGSGKEIKALQVAATSYYEEMPKLTAKIERDINKSAIFDYAQLSASIASVIALIIVIYQTKLLRLQTANLDNSIKAATYQNIASNYIEINKVLATDPALGATFDSFDQAFGESPLELDLPTQRRKKWLAFWLINHYENAFTQYSIGGLATQQWEGVAADCVYHLCGRPYLKNLVEESRGVLSKPFIEFLDEHNRVHSRRS